MTALGIDIGASGYRVLVSDGAMFGNRLLGDDVSALGQLRVQLAELAKRTLPPRHVAVVCGAHLTEAGCITGWPNRRGWIGYELGRFFTQTFGVFPVFEDDGSAAAIAEARTFSQDPVVYIGLGTGVGGGVVIDGRLLRGANRKAMEIGHIEISSIGSQCSCGKIGCLQAVAGGRALMAEVKRWSGEENLAILDRGLAVGDTWAIELGSQVASALREAIEMLVAIFDPAHVVLGGGVATAVPELVAAAINEIDVPCSITKAKFGAESSVRGALLIAEAQAKKEWL